MSNVKHPKLVFISTNNPKKYHLFNNLAQCGVSQFTKVTLTSAINMNLHCCKYCKTIKELKNATNMVFVTADRKPKRYHFYDTLESCNVFKYKKISLGKAKKLNLKCCSRCLAAQQARPRYFSDIILGGVNGVLEKMKNFLGCISNQNTYSNVQEEV